MKRTRFIRIVAPMALLFSIVLAGCSSGGYWGVNGSIPERNINYYVGDNGRGAPPPGYRGHRHDSKEYIKWQKKQRKMQKKEAKRRAKAYKKAMKKSRKSHGHHRHHHDDD